MGGLGGNGGFRGEGGQCRGLYRVWWVLEGVHGRGKGGWGGGVDRGERVAGALAQSRGSAGVRCEAGGRVRGLIRCCGTATCACMAPYLQSMM